MEVVFHFILPPQDGCSISCDECQNLLGLSSKEITGKASIFWSCSVKGRWEAEQSLQEGFLFVYKGAHCRLPERWRDLGRGRSKPEAVTLGKRGWGGRDSGGREDKMQGTDPAGWADTAVSSVQPALGQTKQGQKVGDTDPRTTLQISGVNSESGVSSSATFNHR